ncbi:hypothetical protein GUJ93_ZPchr0006g44241 [Zizania palustris]|uniref:Uncharacterized protein n=1 Tax=Zizania palustris TaxID=103762 RepID=A0A8J5SZB4_ZIZPA|nr:hypothetical protein GUJ93_ZPchr0006g44241 [Zizania palustris]
MARLLRPRLVAIVELAVAIWLAATSGYKCLQQGVPPPVQLDAAAGNHIPLTPAPPSGGPTHGPVRDSTREPPPAA